MMRIAATDQEARSRWASLPSLAGVVQLGGARPGASVLAVMDELGINAPVVAVQRFGAGRTALFAGPGELALEDAAPRLGRQLRPVLAADRALAHRRRARAHHRDAAGLGAARRSGRRCPSSCARLSIAPSPQDELRVRVEAPDGKTIDIIPSLTDPARGLFTARVPAAERGIYRAEVVRTTGTSSAARTELRWLVGGLDRELADPRLNESGLRRLAEASGGRYGTADQGAAVAGWAIQAAAVREPAAGMARRMAYRMDVPVDGAAGLDRVGASTTVGAAMRRHVAAVRVGRAGLGGAGLGARTAMRSSSPGRPGGEAFVATYTTWAQQLSSAFTDHLGFPADHVIVLSGTSADEAQQSTQQNVRAAIARLRREVQRDDLLRRPAGRTRDRRRRAGEVQSRRPRPDVGGVGRAAERPAGPRHRGQHLRRQLPVSPRSRRPGPHRRDGHRVHGAAVRHGLSAST